MTASNAIKARVLAGIKGAFIDRAKDRRMTEANNRQIILVSRPYGEPKLENFKLAEAPVPAIGPGQVLLKTAFLSLDPYMRGRMSDAKSYVPPFAIGEPLGGQTVSKVIASNNPEFVAGDMVLAFGGWQEYSVANGGDLRKLDPSAAPVSTAENFSVSSFLSASSILMPRVSASIFITAAPMSVKGT